jgi:hypothetical protein
MRTFIAGLVAFICFQYLFSQKTDLEIPYYPNETADFSLKYGIFKVGEAHLEFSYNKKCSGAYILAYAKSSGLFKLISNVHYRYECCMDTATGLPITDSRILMEDNYVDISTVYYDHLSLKDSSLMYSKKTDTIIGPKNIYDLLSGFYHYRVNYLEDNMPPHHSITITTFFIDEIWDLTIRYCGKDTISTIFGNTECLIVKPITIIGHFFRTSDAMSIWITNDGKYIPVKFSINLRIGSLHGNITDYKKPQY